MIQKSKFTKSTLSPFFSHILPALLDDECEFNGRSFDNNKNEQSQIYNKKHVDNTQLYHASSANTIGSPMKFPTTGLSVAATIDAFSSSVMREATSANTSVIKCG